MTKAAVTPRACAAEIDSTACGTARAPTYTTPSRSSSSASWASTRAAVGLPSSAPVTRAARRRGPRGPARPPPARRASHGPDGAPRAYSVRSGRITDGHGEVVGRPRELAQPPEGEAEAELRVVVIGREAGDDGELARGVLEPPGVEQGAGQGLPDRLRGRLLLGGPGQQLGRRRGVAALEERGSSPEPVIGVTRGGIRPLGRCGHPVMVARPPAGARATRDAATTSTSYRDAAPPAARKNRLRRLPRTSTTSPASHRRQRRRTTAVKAVQSTVSTRAADRDAD